MHWIGHLSAGAEVRRGGAPGHRRGGHPARGRQHREPASGRYGQRQDHRNRRGHRRGSRRRAGAEAVGGGCGQRPGRGTRQRHGGRGARHRRLRERGSDPAGALANGTVDVVLGIDDSASDGDFWRSASYLPTGIALFALSPDAGIPTQDSGATFAAQVSSKSAWAVSNGFGESSLTPTDSLKEAFEALDVSNGFGESSLTPTDSLKEAFEALEAGSVQYVAADAVIGLYAAHGQGLALEAGSVQYVAADAVIGLYAAHGQGLDVSIVAMLMSPTGYCMGVSNENVDLQTAAGDVLARLVSDGTINVIERKWLGTTVALGDLTVVSDLTASAADAATGSDNEDAGDTGDTGDTGSSDSGDTGSEDTGSGDSSDGSDESGDTGSGDDSGSEDSGDAGDSGSSGDEDAAE